MYASRGVRARVPQSEYLAVMLPLRYRASRHVVPVGLFLQLMSAYLLLVWSSQTLLFFIGILLLIGGSLLPALVLLRFRSGSLRDLALGSLVTSALLCGTLALGPHTPDPEPVVVATIAAPNSPAEDTRPDIDPIEAELRARLTTGGLFISLTHLATLSERNEAIAVRAHDLAFRLTVFAKASAAVSDLNCPLVYQTDCASGLRK